MGPANARPLPPGRRQEVDELLRAVGEWARDRGDLRAVALVGSWARCSAHADSDVDIVLLTDAPDAYVQGADWARSLGAVAVVRTQRWGILTERRVALAGGLVVEFGIATPAWASTTPLDEGTARVVADGLVALYDPSALLAELVEAVEQLTDASPHAPRARGYPK